MDSKTDRKLQYTLPLTTAQRLALIDRLRECVNPESNGTKRYIGLLYLDRKDAIETLELLLDDLKSNRPRMYAGQMSLALSSRL